MKKLLTGFCVLALGAGVLAGCTERSDRVGGADRDRTSPSASPGMLPGDSATRPTPPPRPPSGASESPATSPSPDAGSTTSSSPGSSK
jgi:hypothetical protein